MQPQDMTPQDNQAPGPVAAEAPVAPTPAPPSASARDWPPTDGQTPVPAGQMPAANLKKSKAMPIALAVLILVIVIFAAYYWFSIRK